jgi:hypothetical protein
MEGPQAEFCGNCGSKVKPDAIYCNRCGHRIGEFIPPPPAERRRPIAGLAALIAVLAVIGIGMGIILGRVLTGGRRLNLSFLRPAAASPSATLPVATTSPTEPSSSATPLASLTATATTAPTATRTPTSTSIATATPTTTHTAVPTPTQTHRPSPTASCTLAAGPTFGSLWVGEVKNDIGCPTSREQGVITAYQEFDGGFMIWRSDKDQIVYVFYKDGTYGEFTPTWQDGMPEYGCPDSSIPSTSPPTPRRGFGSVWCNYSVVRQRLGWARTDEIGDYRNLQDFQRGWMLQRAPRAGEPRYVAYSDTDTWEQH